MADIAINPVSRRVQYTGNTGLGPFAFTFNILADADIAVYKNTTLLTLTSEYTVATNADGTGSITLTGSGNGTALVASDVLTLIGARQLERTTDFVAGGDFFAASINEQLDSQVIMAQQLDEKLTRAIKVNPGDEFTDLELPLKADRIGKTLQFNATTGDPEAGPSIADVANAQSNALAAASSATAAATSASSASSSASSASSSATSASSSATAASASETAAAASESAAATSETNAANSASSASTAASNAAASASAAATSESNAATSETNAASSASSASSAQTAAEAARDATLAAYDNFDDRYLGAKASDPTLDNDGNALIAGALYFNTVAEEMRLYTGSAWVAAYVSGSGFLALSGGTMTGDLNFGDNVKANFGAGSDLQIFHDSTNSVIKDVGTGHLYIAATDFLVTNSAISQNYITAVDGGAVTAYHNGSAKLATTSTGVAVTGDATFADNGKAIFGAGSDLQIYHDGSNSYISDVGTGNLRIQGVNVQFESTNGDIYFNCLNNAQVSLRYDNSTKFETTSYGVLVAGSAVASTFTGSISGTALLDFNAYQNFVLTLTGNITLSNPTTEKVGQSGFIVLKQDATGGRTVSLGTDYETAGGAGLTLSSSVNTTDVVPYIVAASGRILLGAPQLAFA